MGWNEATESGQQAGPSGGKLGPSNNSDPGVALQFPLLRLRRLPRRRPSPIGVWPANSRGRVLRHHSGCRTSWTAFLGTVVHSSSMLLSHK
ncbi:hypothetical protein EV1_003677 [Malus domestica]